jgi:hypothetical protein
LLNGGGSEKVGVEFFVRGDLARNPVANGHRPWTGFVYKKVTVLCVDAAGKGISIDILHGSRIANRK